MVDKYFFQKVPGIFRFVTLSLKIQEKTKLHLRKLHKVVQQPLGIPRPKTKFHIILFWLGENCTLFYLIPEISICSSIRLEVPCSHFLDLFFGMANNACNHHIFFSIKTFITMYKQTIYSQQNLIITIWISLLLFSATASAARLISNYLGLLYLPFWGFY